MATTEFQPLLNQPTRLYPIKPIGVGTAYVESLTSYICRLAEAHCVTLGILIRKEVSRQLEFDSIVTSMINNRTRLLNGLSSNSVQTLKSLRTLTGVENLDALTINKWEHISPMKVFKDYKAWCPKCYYEQREEKKELYDPLLWGFSVTSSCSRHKQSLISRCPHCDKLIPFLTSKMRNGYCPYCNKWLGDNQSTDFVTQDNIWSEWVNTNLGEILSEQNKAFDKKIMIANFRTIIDTVPTHAFFRRITGFNKSFTKLTSGRIPLLEDVLKLCYCLNIPLSNLTSTILHTKEMFFPKNPIHSVKIKSKFNNDRVLEHLRDQLGDCSGYTQSNTKIAESVGCSVTTLNKWFPHEMKLLVAKRKEEMNQEKINQENAIRKAVNDMLHEGVVPKEYVVKKRLNMAWWGNSRYAKVFKEAKKIRIN